MTSIYPKNCEMYLNGPNTINMAKTKETVFHKPNSRNVLFPSELPGIKSLV